MPLAFTHDLPSQRVVFARGALARVGEEAERLGMTRALVVATPGSGARLGQRVVAILGPRAGGLAAKHPQNDIVNLTATDSPHSPEIRRGPSHGNGEGGR